METYRLSYQINRIRRLQIKSALQGGPQINAEYTYGIRRGPCTTNRVNWVLDHLL